MNTQELKKLIREAIREEIKEILIEAVEIASRPNLQQEQKQTTPIQKTVKPPLDPITRILEETRMGMTREEYHKITGTGVEHTLPTPTERPTGTRPEDIKNVDLSMIPGIGKAAEILKEAQKKDRERYQ